MSNSSRNSSPARSHRGKGNSRNNSPHGRFDIRTLFTESSFQKFLFFLLSVPEATLDETPLTAAPVPHQGKQGFSGELAARGFIFLFFARGFFWSKTQFSPKLTISPGALGGEALCQGLHRLHTLTGEMLANVVNYCQIKNFT